MTTAKKTATRALTTQRIKPDNQNSGDSASGGAEQVAKARKTARNKPTRAEKATHTRAALLEAAVEVVGEVGYQGAMVSLITSKAGIAQGTFYNYFDSLQDLLDQLLPTVGRFMLDHIQLRAKDAKDEREREEKRFQAYFTFLEKHPSYYRILYEAEVFAPESSRQHRDTVVRGLRRLLERARLAGELADCEPRELEVLTMMMLGARHYLSMRYARDGNEPAKLPKWVTKAYMKFLSAGIFG